MRRSVAVPVLAGGLFLGFASPADAGDLTSPSYILHSPTLGGGGGVDLVGESGTAFARGTTLAQASPLGESVGGTTGVRLLAGFWPTVVGGAAGEDSDGDGVVDALDNCVDQANGPDAGPNDQLDTDSDGYGDVCDGDLNQDGFVGGPDFDIFLQCFNRATGGGGPADDPDCAESDMNGDGFVGGPDFDLFLQVFNGPPGPSALANGG